MSFREHIKRIKVLHDLGRAVKDRAWLWKASRRASYAQNGEDRALLELFPTTAQGTYVDLGANHPYKISNTYLLYTRGWRGICVDPIPTLARLHRRHRPRDIFLNVGVGTDAGACDFYEMSAPELSTFSAEIAHELESTGRALIVRTHRIATLSVVDIVHRLNPTGVFDVLSIDIEGLDVEIVRHTDWEAVRPKVVLCETSSFEHDWTSEIVRLFAERGYVHRCHVGCNDIFVRDSVGPPS